ncbi:SRPBCC domain-containing protein [Kribbella sp. CA-245084]|uniref:SRPBCC domain-containing protein n=1 Tax=Kribbella sp. CA-245084 TaxID=3239940 RepID=UPI003D8BA611
MTSSGASRVLGRLAVADGAGVVRIEDRYDTDINDLWSAVTEPDRLARWYGKVDGDLRLGGAFTLYVESADLHSTGRVDVCEPPRNVRVTTRETVESAERGNGPAPFDKTIEATLTADGEQTILTIEVRGVPLDKIEYFGIGWQIHAENLAAYLAGSERTDTESHRAELVAAYQALSTAVR